jgi:hypothetical protein
MAWVKVGDIVYERFKAPGLDDMEEYLARFGLIRAERAEAAGGCFASHLRHERSILSEQYNG